MQQATLARIVPDHLYLSSMLAARDRDLLVQQRIEHIINATSDLENTFALDGRFSYHTCPLDDDPEEDLTPHLDPAHAIIEQAGREGKRVLVHCRAGRSRSASIVISYLMKKKGMTLKEAYLLVKEQKPDIRPNEGYLKQLQMLDKEIHGAVSFDLLAFNTEVIVGMGFSQEQAAKALRECDGDLDLAINRLFWIAK